MKNVLLGDSSFRINIIVSEFIEDSALVVVLKPFDIIKCSDESCILLINEYSWLRSNHYVDFKLTYDIRLKQLINLSNQQESCTEENKIFKQNGIIPQSCLYKIQSEAVKNKNSIKSVLHKYINNF